MEKGCVLSFGFVPYHVLGQPDLIAETLPALVRVQRRNLNAQRAETKEKTVLVEEIYIFLHDRKYFVKEFAVITNSLVLLHGFAEAYKKSVFPADICF